MENTTQSTPTPQKNNLSPALILGVLGLLVVGGIGIIWARNNSAMNTETKTNEVTTSPIASATPIDAANPAAAPSTSTPGASDTATPDSEVQIVNVEAGSFYFKPNEIRVKQGQKVKIVMKSVSMMHDFVIDELGVKMPITQSGKTGTVEFTATKKGTFEYYCSVASHRKMGQVGKLIVE